MLHEWKFALTFPAGERTNVSMGSIFHGAWMELLDTNYVATLHEQGIRPYTQGLILAKEKQPIWRVTTLTDEAAEKMVQPLLSQQQLFLRQRHYVVALQVMEEKSVTAESLADRAFTEETVAKYGKLKFLTPTSFKHNESYMMFPDLTMIFASLLRKWNTFIPDIKVQEPDLEQKLAEVCLCTRYNLHSSIFALERTRITGFRGDMSFRFLGTEMEKRILSLLFSFAPFAGIGIKTALGMGQADIE